MLVSRWDDDTPINLLQPTREGSSLSKGWKAIPLIADQCFITTSTYRWRWWRMNRLQTFVNSWRTGGGRRGGGRDQWERESRHRGFFNWFLGFLFLLHAYTPAVCVYGVRSNRVVKGSAVCIAAWRNGAFTTRSLLFRSKVQVTIICKNSRLGSKREGEGRGAM